MAFGASLYKQLAANELIIPYLTNAFLSEKWMDEIRIPMRVHESRWDGYFHPSVHALLSERWLYYQFAPEHRDKLRYRRERKVEDILSPLMGTIFHAIIQEKMKVSGLVEDKHIEIKLTNVAHHGRGRMDLIFPDHPLKKKDIPVDIKTANPQSFAQMRYPSKSYETQLQMYMDWYGELTGQIVEEGVILVVEMGRPFRMKEFRIKRNEQILEDVYGRWDRVREAVALGIPPTKKCCALNSKAMDGCSGKIACLESY